MRHLARVLARNPDHLAARKAWPVMEIGMRAHHRLELFDQVQAILIPAPW